MRRSRNPFRPVRFAASASAVTSSRVRYSRERVSAFLRRRGGNFAEFAARGNATTAPLSSRAGESVRGLVVRKSVFMAKFLSSSLSGFPLRRERRAAIGTDFVLHAGEQVSGDNVSRGWMRAERASRLTTVRYVVRQGKEGLL